MKTRGADVVSMDLDLCSMHKPAELMGTRYAIWSSFADTMHFSRKLLKSAGLPANYERMSLYALMAWAHSMLHGDEAIKAGWNCLHCIRLLPLQF